MSSGHAAFIMGQLPVRTGMTTIGIPGSTRGIQKSDPTLAEVLKTQGYATAQFGKNHLGDRNDEWFGNLYHLNAEEEPEELDDPGQKNPACKVKFGPRGALHTWATNVDDPTTDPKFGRVGRQKIEDTGPLTRKRMETFDAEVLAETLKWMDKNGKTGKPFFMWFNSTAIHVWSHPNPKYVQMAVNEGLKADLLKGYKMGDTTYKAHLDGYNNLDLWTGKAEKSARREIFYYDETDLMALRVDGWKMHICVKLHNNWFDPKTCPSVPYVENLLMDPMEKMTPDSDEFGYIGRAFFAHKLWAPTAAGPFLTEHLKSLEEFPPSQGADTLA